MSSTIRAPKNEVILMQYCNAESDPMFVITSNEYREFYTLYEVSDGKLSKLGRSKDPAALVSKYCVEEKLGW